MSLPAWAKMPVIGARNPTRIASAADAGPVARSTTMVPIAPIHPSKREIVMDSSASRPFQPGEDRESHHPVLILLGEEIERLGEMGDALAIGRRGERVCHVGAPIAALPAKRLEDALEIRRHVAKRI